MEVHHPGYLGDYSLQGYIFLGSLKTSNREVELVSDLKQLVEDFLSIWKPYFTF
jgi:hypothetical protein